MPSVIKAVSALDYGTKYLFLQYPNELLSLVTVSVKQQQYSLKKQSACAALWVVI